jgi:SulP family sulfate permease
VQRARGHERGVGGGDDDDGFCQNHCCRRRSLSAPTIGSGCLRRGRLMRDRRSVVGWLGAYQWGDLRYDVVAGVTVSALVVPKALGYAGIAQVPIQNGLYAAAAGAIVYALLGSSRQISTGPSSALAAVAASAVVLTGVSGGDKAELVAAITLATGALFLAAAVLRMGWMSQFLSKAVITGFLFGAAIDVVVGELPKLTGTKADGTNSWRQFGAWIKTLDEYHTTTLVVGVIALVVIFALHVIAPKVPGALVLVAGGLLASWVFDLADHGVATVGHVPRGVPAPSLPAASIFGDHYATIGVAALGLFLIGFSQTAGDARMFAARHRYRINVNREMVAQGLANGTAGVFQGMPVSTSLSASSLNDASGARTQMASIVTGVVVILTLLVLAPLFSDLPKPVLGALIIDAVVFGMIDLPEMRRLWRVKRFDFWIAVMAIIAVLSAGVLAGVVIGIALSVGWLVYVNSLPAMTELGRRVGTTGFRPLEDHPGDQTYPGLLIERFDGGLTFVTADGLADGVRVRYLEAREPITAIIIDFAGVNFVDSQGAEELRNIVTFAHQEGISLRLARVRSKVMTVLRADNVTALLGEERFHANLDEAVQAELTRESN